uniref:SH3 domain-containing protein n=1 Tax=Amphimedon queenslandica TaxID=400682 RepID=A0A1X7SS09_AMPQE
REKALLEYKKEIELLQENISITRKQLLMSQKANIHKTGQCKQTPTATRTAKSIYTSCIDYQGIYSHHLGFSEGEQLEIYDKCDIFYGEEDPWHLVMRETFQVVVFTQCWSHFNCWSFY